MTNIPAQNGKLAVITGGNRGLGFEIAAELAAAGAHLVLACRDPARATAAIDRIHVRHPAATLEAMTLDVADLDSIRKFAEAFKTRHARLDLLIHNAAAIMAPQGLTKDGFETHFGTNHLGPFALTGLLLERLDAAPAARVVGLASIAHTLTKGLDPDDPGLARRPYRTMDAYGRSKLATLLYTRELNRRLQRAQSPTIALAAHPGYSSTNPDFGGFFMRLSTRLFAQSPADGARPILHAATDPAARGNDYFGPGGYRELKGAPAPAARSAAAADDVLAHRLWEVSERLTGVRYLDA